MVGQGPATGMQSVSAPSVIQKFTRPLAVVTTLFFMWGFLTSLNDILVPQMKSVFDLSYARVMLIQFAFFSAYFLFSIPWSKVVNAIGYQKTMVSGLLIMAAGAFLFVPAATSASFPLFLGALIVLAAGITGLQVAANPYVVVLGKPETASSRLVLTQAFNSLGTTIAPKLGGLLMLSAAPLAIEELHRLSPQALHLYRVQEAASVKMPYVVIGIALLLLAALIASSRLPNIEAAANPTVEKVRDSIWRHPNLVFGALGIFTYVGAEVSIGSFLVNYLGQADIAGLSAKTAAGYVSLYWGGAMVGRFLGAAVLRRVKTGHLLALCAVCTSALVIISMLSSGHIAMWSILAVGFFNSIMFPCIFSLAVAELGPLTGNGSGILNMAIVGGAIVPVIQGAIADRIGIHHAFFVPVICYMCILFYALSGSKPNSERYASA
ncbi:MAG: putative mannose transporter, family [Candidatus Angelobacter sp.]|jgi:FHS family L-fucose permease-like MFS transporter|nr:putative mannose transporter, family [Candidatus Angelobacter sp.]